MIRILIAGANSYVGNNVKHYLEKEDPKRYSVEVLDMVKEQWQTTNFKTYDVVINVCAIVHRPKEKEELYYKVNRDIAIDLAKRCSSSGVKQFIQISTASVFGVELGSITLDTECNPYSAYGKSKLEADICIQKMSTRNFKVCIIRPPMIYGKGCKGNYTKLERFALHFPIFPSLENKKNFIYVENVSDFIKYLIDKELGGVFYPTDSELISTVEIVKGVARLNGKRIYLWSVFNPLIKFLIKHNMTVKKIFGDNYYEINDESGWKAPYTFEDALERIYNNE